MIPKLGGLFDFVFSDALKETVIPLDPSAGSSQEYIEDCPICHPNVIHIAIDEGSEVWVWAEPGRR